MAHSTVNVAISASESGNRIATLKMEDGHMKPAVSVAAVLLALFLSNTANASSLRIQCKKLTDDNVVCRFLFTDGQVARGMPVQLVDENSDKVLANGRTDAQGMYAFKPPALEYNVVIEANKGHVASISSEDIW